jgi:DNA primase
LRCCGQGGDILTFVQNYDKVDFREALHRLAARAGVELPDERARKQQVEENARLFQANEAAAEFFRDELKRPRVSGQPRIWPVEASSRRRSTRSVSATRRTRDIRCTRR